MERVQFITRLSHESPKLPADFKVSDEILNMACFKLPTPTQEELDDDAKYAYLYEKYIKNQD